MLTVRATMVAAALCACEASRLRDTTHDFCSDAGPEPGGGGGAMSTVFLVVLENQDWSAVQDRARAPYIHDVLLPRYAHAEAYRTGGVHPSLPNYITLEAGDPLGIDFDADATEVRLPVACHLTSYLRDLGMSWKVYAEGVDGKGCPTADHGRYVARHNPVVYFDDVTGGYCVDHVRPFSELAGDLAAGTVPRYAFLVPDLCSDGHDSCDPENDGVAQADAFLSRTLPSILASPAFASAVVLITWDESAHGDEPIGLIAVSPFAKPGYASSAPFSHASTLRTVQEILGATPLLRRAAAANDLADLFTTFP